MNVTIVKVTDVDNIFPKCVEYLQQSIDNGAGDLTVPYLLEECRSGRAFLIVDFAVEHIIVMRFEIKHGKSVARILAFGGSSTGNFDWNSEIKQLAEYCGQFGATSLVFSGREAWKKLSGIKVIATVYEMETKQ